MTIAVIGGGRWGCILAMLFHLAGHKVKLACRTEDAERLRKDNRIPHTNYRLDEGIAIVTEGRGLSDCEIVFIAVDGKNLRSCWEQWGQFVQGIVAVAVKSLDVSEGKLVLPMDMIDYERVVYFASGAFPEDIMSDSLVVGALYGDRELALKVRTVIPQEKIRTYLSPDLIGGQICSALKNVLALAAGMASGLKQREMTVAAVIGRGLSEISRFAISMGGYPATFDLGSAVSIDTIGTCISKDSHNFRAGRMLAKGFTIDEVENEIGTVEGIWTAMALRRVLGWELNNMPICSAVVSILFDGISPELALQKLRERPLSR